MALDVIHLRKLLAMLFTDDKSQRLAIRSEIRREIAHAVGEVTSGGISMCRSGQMPERMYLEAMTFILWSMCGLSLMNDGGTYTRAFETAFFCGGTSDGGGLMNRFTPVDP